MDRRSTHSGSESESPATDTLTVTGRTMANAAAAQAYMERLLHMDPVHRLMKLLDDHNSEAAKSPREGTVGKTADVQAERTGLVKDSLVKQTTTATAAVSLAGSMSRADLAAALAALSPYQREILASVIANYPSKPPDAAKFLAGRALLELADQGLSDDYITNALVAMAKLPDLSDPSEAARVAAQLAKLAPADRVLVIGHQPEPIQAILAKYGHAPTLPGKDFDPGHEDARRFVAIMTSGAKGTLDAAELEKTWRLLASDAQEKLLADMKGFTGAVEGSAGYRTLVIGLVASPAQRRSHLDEIVAACVADTTGNLALVPDSLGAQLHALFSELTPEQDGKLEPLLGSANPALLAAGKSGAGPAIETTSTKFSKVARPRTPVIRHDHGFLDDGHGNIDESKRRAPTAGDYAAKVYWEGKLKGAQALRPDLIDATRAYAHFLEGTGSNLEFSYEKFAKDDPSGAMVVASCIEEMKEGAVAQSDRDGKIAEQFVIQSGGIPVGHDDRFPYPLTEDWQKAIGAHFVWLAGAVKVEVDGSGVRHFVVEMTLRAEDRYNFNPGNVDAATGTPDAENGRFEQSGLGREFYSRATMRRTFEFDDRAGTAIRLPHAPKKSGR